MAKVQPSSKTTPKCQAVQRESWRAPHSGRGPGHLAGLAALINNSPRVLAQRELAASMQGNPLVQALSEKAAWMNSRQPATAEPPMTQPAQLQSLPAPTPDQTGLHANLKAGIENQNAAPQPPVVQGKWFRMSTRLTEQDEQEIAAIQKLADSADFFHAFWMIVYQYPELANSYKKILAKTSNEEIHAAAFNTLWETFEDSAKAYTAAEVVEELENNEIISQEADAEAFGAPVVDDEEMESLITKFSELSISVPFHSDADDKKEEHHVFREGEEVIVESNPKPLKAITQAKNWLGIVIPAAKATQLEGLRATAKKALYKIAGKAKHGITGSRTKANLNAFRAALQAIANVLKNLKGAAHAASLLPATDLNTSTDYGNDTQPTEGTKVIAAPLSVNSATAGSAPHDGRLMTAIRKLAGPQSKSYVQMHLLNDLVFGPGQLWNLTPGPKQSNVDMENNVEDPLKRAILGKGLVIDFEAKVNYKNDPNSATNKGIDQNPDKYRFQSISFKAVQKEYDDTTKTWGVAGVQDPDVSSIHGSTVNWRYGSLTPLTPKPRILDPATTVADLMAAGIQKAAADRIHAWVAAGLPGWKGGGKNKQQALAKAVKAWDNRKTIPNISSWKATAVLWT